MSPRSASAVAALLLAVLAPARVFAADRIAEIRFHGNYSIPDGELARAAGVAPGDELPPGGVEEIERRLRRVRRVESVSIERRYRSMTGTGDMVLLVNVTERAPLSKKWMVFPILSGSDEYGLEFGARLTAIDLLGAGERISFPATWGGVRRIAAEARFDSPIPVASTFLAGASLSQKEHPHYKLADRRTELWGGATRRLEMFDVDGTVQRSRVHFDRDDHGFWSWGAGIAFDTRRDTAFPRDAVYSRVGWEQLAFDGGGPADVNRYRMDMRGYKGLWGTTVLAAQVLLHRSDGPLPRYEQPFLGGAGTLRGHPPGEFANDNLAVGSIELRMPFSSPLSVHRSGMLLFFDSGAVYEHGRKLGDAAFHHGAGVGFFVTVAGFGIKVDVAHDLHRRVRVHFSTGFRF